MEMSSIGLLSLAVYFHSSRYERNFCLTSRAYAAGSKAAGQYEALVGQGASRDERGADELRIRHRVCSNSSGETVCVLYRSASLSSHRVRVVLSAPRKPRWTFS